MPVGAESKAITIYLVYFIHLESNIAQEKYHF